MENLVVNHDSDLQKQCLQNQWREYHYWFEKRNLKGSNQELYVEKQKNHNKYQGRYHWKIVMKVKWSEKEK